MGAGDLGLEIYEWFQEAIEAAEMEIGGFLDGRPNALDGSGIEAKVLGDPLTYALAHNDVFVCAIGNPAPRKSVCNALASRGAKFVTLIHPKALVCASSRVGEGCVLFPFAVVDGRTEIREHCVLYFHASVGHQVTVGPYSMLLAGSLVGSRCELGEGVVMATNSFSRTGIRIGDDALVGACSFAAKDITPGYSVLGVPARQLGTVRAPL